MDQANRLEQALRVWEDLCFLRRTRVIALTALKKQPPYPLVPGSFGEGSEKVTPMWNRRGRR